VADQQPLHVGRHAEVPREQDVEPGRHVAGAGHDGEQADVLGGDPGLLERLADRPVAERHGLVEVAAHARAGAPLDRVLLRARVDHEVAGLDARHPPDLAGERVAGPVRVEEVVPQLLLADGGGDGVAGPDDPGQAEAGTDLRPDGLRRPRLLVHLVLL
jgi:hypothetical protein